jgi:hypothetical protein
VCSSDLCFAADERHAGIGVVVVREIMSEMKNGGTSLPDGMEGAIRGKVLDDNPCSFIRLFANSDDDTIHAVEQCLDRAASETSGSLWENDPLMGMLDVVIACAVEPVHELFFNFFIKKDINTSSEAYEAFLWLAAVRGFCCKYVSRFETSHFPSPDAFGEKILPLINVDELLDLLSKKEIEEKIGGAAPRFLAESLRNVGTRAALESRLKKIREVLGEDRMAEFVKHLDSRFCSLVPELGQYTAGEADGDYDPEGKGGDSDDSGDDSHFVSLDESDGDGDDVLNASFYGLPGDDGNNGEMINFSADEDSS